MSAEHESADDNQPRLFGITIRQWGGLKDLFTIVGVVLAVGTGISGLYQYMNKLEADRAEETLKMIDSWETRGYREDFNALRVEVVAFLDAVPDAEMRTAQQSAKASENLKGKLYRDVVGSASARKRFDNIVYYFNRLGLCIEARLCSKRTARIFFDDTLENFLSVFQSLIEKEREATPGYAEGLIVLEKELLP